MAKEKIKSESNSKSLLDRITKNSNIKEFLCDEDDTKVDDFISTDCVTLNLACSGGVAKGIPVGRVTTIAAPSSLGKSLIALKILKNAQKKGKVAVLIDTEFAYDPEVSRKMGINTNDLIVCQESSLEEVQKFVMNLVEPVEKDERKDIVIILDSFGGLITSKTMIDATSGKDVSDMTISKKKNSFARLLQSLRCTVFIVNHVYDNVGGFGDPLSIPGGRGIFFASSVIILGVSKAKDKDSEEITGALISCSVRKSRFSKEHSKFKYRIKYEGGIDPYYGLLDLVEDFSALQEKNGLTKPLYKSKPGWFTLNVGGVEKNMREKDLYCAEVWKPIFKEYPGFIKYLEEEFSFKHSSIVNEDLNFVE